MRVDKSQSAITIADPYRYRAHVTVTVRAVGRDEEPSITLNAPLSLQAAESAITAALAVIRTAGEIDPAVLTAGRQLLVNLPHVLDRLVANPALMPVDIFARDI
jgi:hypothetical protein